MLSDIFEKETSLKPIKPPTASSSGFPQTFKRDKTVKDFADNLDSFDFLSMSLFCF